MECLLSVTGEKIPMNDGSTSECSDAFLSIHGVSETVGIYKVISDVELSDRCMIDDRLRRCIEVVVHCFCYCSTLRSQTPVHEAPLLEGHPPLAGLASAICIEPLDQSRSQFLANLREILAKVFSVSSATWGRVMCVQNEVGISRDREVVHRKGVKHLGCFDLGGWGARAAKLS